jgi:Domain of unknown function (DUF5645)
VSETAAIVMDVLREVDDDELDFVIYKLRQHLPYAIIDLHFILAAKRSRELSKTFPNISEKLLPKFYVPQNGLMENCTIFSVAGESYHTVWYFTFEESLDEVKYCLDKTKLINWSEKVLFVTIHSKHVGPIFECVEKKNCLLQGSYPSFYCWLAKEEAENIVIE